MTRIGRCGLGVSLAELAGVTGNWRLATMVAFANDVRVPAVSVGLLVLFQSAAAETAQFQGQPTDCGDSGCSENLPEHSHTRLQESEKATRPANAVVHLVVQFGPELVRRCV